MWSIANPPPFPLRLDWLLTAFGVLTHPPPSRGTGNFPFCINLAWVGEGGAWALPLSLPSHPLRRVARALMLCWKPAGSYWLTDLLTLSSSSPPNYAFGQCSSPLYYGCHILITSYSFYTPRSFPYSAPTFVSESDKGLSRFIKDDAIMYALL